MKDAGERRDAVAYVWFHGKAPPIGDLEQW